MPTPSTQITSAEFEAISSDPWIQELLRLYPDRHPQIIAGWRRRNSHQGCTCPWQHRKTGRCCTIDRLPDRRRERQRRRPSPRGQYQKQLHK